MAADFPHRVRLHGGRNTHAARDILDGPDRITGCDYYLDAAATNHELPADEPVTCPACKRRLARAEPPQ
ncbi:hypothetical protein [Streptomyces fradiae]|uniref:hypothetical protein n=1 Tax=Streptomyces fradiae TaxID=1906 RepID=UPI0036FC404E